ncbi:MAG TPA: class IV adenylate cyclase [Acidobacteriota bacterium]|nr:class IV adenylate cyclase [Acidobacteriota bacterium]
MPANIEIKARTENFAGLQEKLSALSGSHPEMLLQEDTFFHSPNGRLKLRVLQSGPAQLIQYDRPDQQGPKRSNYQVFETNEPESLKSTLSRAFGIRGVVRKERLLYLVGQTRVHLDRVEQLGNFVELEVVLRPGQSDTEGQEIAQDLMAKLNIRAEDLLKGAYIDLLSQKHNQRT